jgi:cytosine/adenosine deaminase-related metal-dependent hydrolase
MRGRLGRWCSDDMSDVRKSKAVAKFEFKRQEESTETVLRKNEELLRKYKEGLGNGRIKPWITLLGSRYSSDELLKESKRMADQYNTMLYMHQSPYIDTLYRSREKAGKRPIAWLEDLGVLGPNLLLVHMIHVDDTEIRIVRKYGAKIVHCPSTALKLVYGLSMFGRFPEMMNEAIPVALGSDAAECSNHHDMVRILNLSALVFKDMRFDPYVINAERAIEMATLNGAKVMGLENEIGSLEEGKKADLIIFDMKRPEWVPLHNEIQNLVYSATGDSVETVIIDGKIIIKNRIVQTIDESEVLAKVQELGEKVVKRTGRSITTPWKIV